MGRSAVSAGWLAKFNEPAWMDGSGKGILGAFVGLAATGGFLLNTAFLLAGTTSTNPVLKALASC